MNIREEVFNLGLSVLIGVLLMEFLNVLIAAGAAFVYGGDFWEGVQSMWMVMLIIGVLIGIPLYRETRKNRTE